MSSSQLDPQEYKAKQRQEWGAAAAAWRKHWPAMERDLQPVSEFMVSLAGIQAGQNVLDMATGIGEPAVTVARVVGPQGRVVATDQAPEMLAIARERADGLGLRNIEFLEVDAEELDLPEAEFDAVLCRFGLMFLPNLGEALGRMRRQLKPGGRLVAAVWSQPAQVPMIAMPMSVLQKELEIPSPPPGTPGIFFLADRVKLEGSLKDAEFTGVESEVLSIASRWSSADEYVEQIRDIAAPIQAILSQQTEQKRDSIWQAIRTTAAEQFSTADGSISMQNEVICVSGQA